MDTAATRRLRASQARRRARRAHRADYAIGLALAIIAHGRPYRLGWSDEGTPDSGPRGGIEVGYRWGQLRLVRSRSGGAVVARRDPRRDWTVAHHALTPWGDRRTALATMVDDHLDRLARHADRDLAPFADDHMARRRREARARADHRPRLTWGPAYDDSQPWCDA